MEQITIDDFKKVDIRVGKILRVQEFPKAKRPAYKLWIDFGDLGVKRCSARITKLYELGELLNKQVLAVVNLPPLQVADFISEVLLLGVMLDQDEVALVQPDREVPIGKRVL